MKPTISKPFKSNDRTFEKVFGLFNKKDYFNVKGLAKVQIGNFERALQKNDKNAQQVLDMFKGDDKKAKEYIIQVIHDRKKEQAFNDYKALKDAIDSIQKGKPNVGAVNYVKRIIHNNNQKYSIALYSAISGKKFNNYKDIHKDIDSSINEASKEAMGIAGFTGTRGVAVDDFIKKNNIDARKLFNFVKKGSLRDRMDFVTALAGKPNNKFFKMIVGKFSESVNEGQKRYNQKDGVGKSKYVISYHDGKKKHKDGSDFFDIQIFRNKKDLAKFVNTLHKGGYKYGFDESEDGVPQGYNPMVESKTKESKVIQKIHKYTRTEKKFYDELAKHEVRIGQRDYAKFILMALKGFGINPREYKRIPDAEEKLYQTVSQK
jgi:hypothetical protein